MPRINLPKKKDKTAERNEHTEPRELRRKAYNTRQWREARLNHIVNFPLCQDCLERGVVNAGSLDSPLQVHHMKSPFRNGEIDYDLLIDDNNLRTLCAECHSKRHNASNPEKIIEALEAFFNDIPDKGRS